MEQIVLDFYNKEVNSILDMRINVKPEDGWNKDFFFRQGFSQCNSVFMIIRIGEGSVRCHAGKR